MSEASERKPRLSTRKLEKYRQARRRGARPRERSASGSPEIDRSFDLVPFLGEGCRWYDIPYRLMTWLGSGWPRRVQPEALLSLWNLGINYLLPFNEHHRNLAWPLDDQTHSLLVPDQEHVTVGAVWLVELFPPTDLAALERALRRNGWDDSRLLGRPERGNREALARARAGTGSPWWRVAHLIRKGSLKWGAGAVRAELPNLFETADIRAVQVGDGLTALVCKFEVGDKAATALDEEWHSPHKPRMQFSLRSRPRSLDRRWAAFWNVQSVRRSMHDEARTWLTTNVPGYFGSRRKPQPALDLVLTEVFDPTSSDPSNDSGVSQPHREAFRALALDSHPVYRLTSAELPKLLLDRPQPSMHRAMQGASAWSLWGKRAAVVEAFGEGLRAYGADSDRAIAYRVDERVYNLMVMLGISEMLGIATREQAQVRDTAARLHGKFRPKSLRALRKFLLTSSVDLAMISRDVKSFWDRDWRWEGEARFAYTLAPDHQLADAEAGRKTEDPVDLSATVQSRQEGVLATLLAADRDLRDILSTVASLGASVDGFRLGRVALFVAIVSLVTAVATVLASEISPTSILGWLVESMRVP